MEPSIWDEFTNLYQVQKTLRFELRPEGKTKELLRKIKEEKDFDSPLAPLVLEDEKRADAYKKVKELIDDLHREFLSFSLSTKNITQSQKENLRRHILSLYNIYTRDKKDSGILDIQKELAEVLTKILDNNAPKFFETLNNQKEYLKKLLAKDEKDLKNLKEKRKSIAKKIKETPKNEVEKLELLRIERQKLDKATQGLERTLKEYKKCLNYQFNKAGELYKKTDTLFTLLRLFYIQNQEATKSIKEFDGFHSYFTGFNENRKNIYDIKGKGDKDNWRFLSTSISHRLFEQNMKFHFDNIQKRQNLKTIIEQYENVLYEKNWVWEKELKKIEKNLEFHSEELFQPESFVKFLSQQGIDHYNEYLGGIPAEAREEKIQGLNELINRTRQQAGAGRKQFPPLQEFYKQILSERDGSFIEIFQTNTELINGINEFKKTEEELLKFIKTDDKKTAVASLTELLSEAKASKDNVYVSKDNLRFFSNDLTGNWNALEQWYLDSFSDKEKREQARQKAFTIQQIENTLKEKREWVDEEEAKDKADFYTQFIQKADTTNRDWLKNGSVKPDHIFFSYFEAKFNILVKERKSRLKEYEEKCTSLEKEEPLSDNEKKPIKNYLDASQNLFRFLRSLTVRNKDLERSEEQDDSWKQTIQENFLNKNEITVTYNKTRNFLTKKPYSEKKFKLNFENSTLADGWDVNKETDNTAVILMKEKQYYLAIMRKDENSLFEFVDDVKNKNEIEKSKEEIREQEKKLNNTKQGTQVYEKEINKLDELKKKLDDLELIKSQEGDNYKKMNYKFFKDGTTMIPKCSTQLKEVKEHFSSKSNDFCTSILEKSQFKKDLTITKEIFELNNLVYDKNTNSFIFKKDNGKRPKKFQKEYLRISNNEKGYKDALKKWIGFCKDFCECYTSVAEAGYDYKNTFTRNYDSLDEFYQKLSKCIYKITFSNVSERYINKMVEEEKLYLFQIYSKDFSPNSKGNKNLHTLYWKFLFDDRNLKDVVAKLNGQAELFYRKASVKYSQEKLSKGHHYDNLKEKFNYPILKDKRYSEDKFLFHCPITLNFKAIGVEYFNSKINQYIKDNLEKVNIIGIDRGERNLLYYTVIDQQDNILKQGSLNEIDNGFIPKGENKARKIDYQGKLDKKESERAGARENWETIENIKEIKEGYLSQVVHQLSNLIIKHNAIVVLEDLNFGFKRGRFKVEKQIYQKFEKALINKLNYLVFKDKEFGETGHHLKAYQLTNKFQSFQSFQKLGKQSGILFYTTAAYTSKADPITGYMQNLYPKYSNPENAQEFFSKFDSIIYNGEHFEFTYDLKKLKGMTGSYHDENDNDETKLTKTKWTIHSHIERSQFKERKLSDEEKELPEYESAANGKWKFHQVIDLNKKLKDLFESEGFSLEKDKDYREDICSPKKVDQFEGSKFLAKLTAHFNRLLSMRVTDSSKAKKFLYKDSKSDKKRIRYIHNAQSDFIVSPVYPFYDSRKVSDDKLPKDSDANGAYNIARKGINILERIKEAENISKVELAINKTDWQNYSQSEHIVKRQIEKYSNSTNH